MWGCVVSGAVMCCDDVHVRYDASRPKRSSFIRQLDVDDRTNLSSTSNLTYCPRWLDLCLVFFFSADIAGIMLVVTGFFSFFGSFFTLHPVDAVVHVSRRHCLPAGTHASACYRSLTLALFSPLACLRILRVRALRGRLASLCGPFVVSVLCVGVGIVVAWCCVVRWWRRWRLRCPCRRVRCAQRLPLWLLVRCRLWRVGAGDDWPCFVREEFLQSRTDQRSDPRKSLGPAPASLCAAYSGC